MKLRLGAVALAVVAAASGFVGHQLNKHPSVQAVLTRASLEIDKEGVRYLSRFGFSCGVEFWDVKVMRDSNAGQVNLSPKATNIPNLIGLSGSSGQRPSQQAQQLTGTRLIEYKLEPDSDIHLVLQSTLGSHPTMIAEIPNPMCSANSIVLTQITAARTAFVQEIGPPQTAFTMVNVPVTLVGVTFIDVAHGQTGADPHQIELHPLISFKRAGH